MWYNGRKTAVAGRYETYHESAIVRYGALVHWWLTLRGFGESLPTTSRLATLPNSGAFCVPGRVQGLAAH